MTSKNPAAQAATITPTVLTVTGTATVTGAATFAGNVSVGGTLTLTGSLVGPLTVTGNLTATEFIAGSSTYGATSAVVAGGIQALASGSASSVQANVPPVLNPTGTNYGTGVKIITGILNIPVSDGASSGTATVTLTGPAQSLSVAPLAVATIAPGTSGVTGWNSITVITYSISSGPPYTYVEFNVINSGTATATGQSLNVAYMIVCA